MKVNNDHRSKFSNLKEEAWKIRASTGFELVTSANTGARGSTNWAMKPLSGSEANLIEFISSHEEWNDEKYTDVK